MNTKFVTIDLSSAPVVETDYVGPDPQRMIGALRQIGYSLEQAIADLVDNSINAGANEVLLRFVCEDEKIVTVAIVDNGCGMTDRELREAMKFGSAPQSEEGYLGKYGMGLKLASLSHAQEVTVMTRRNGKARGRRWSIAGIERGWECDILAPEICRETVDAPWGGLDISKNGTVVLWQQVDKLPVSRSGLRSSLRNIQRRLQTHLGMVFHRFLSGGRLTIRLDQQVEGSRQHGLSVAIPPLDPFAYQKSGSSDYPKTFKTNIAGVGPLHVEAHIWPPNSEESEYRLGNRAAARQGFYFYRNDRLIQAGGWSGVVQNDAEPHGSLARVKIDLPDSYDDHFNLNVQKSAVIVPPTFVDGMASALAHDETDFESYRHAAQLIYRSSDRRMVKAYPLVPGPGFSKKLRDIGRELLAPGSNGVQTVGFKWVDLEPKRLFRLDRESKIIQLNSLYRWDLGGDGGPNRNDSPFIKMLLFIVLGGNMRAERISRKQEMQLVILNELLLEALLHESE